jgi:hypothetical protein
VERVKGIEPSSEAWELLGSSMKSRGSCHFLLTRTGRSRWGADGSDNRPGGAAGRKRRHSCCLTIPRSLDDRSRCLLSPIYHRLSLDRGYPRLGMFGWGSLKKLHQKPHTSFPPSFDRFDPYPSDRPDAKTWPARSPIGPPLSTATLPAALALDAASQLVSQAGPGESFGGRRYRRDCLGAKTIKAMPPTG